ncbi:MAG: hypothetical protein IRZ14_00085 [Chloroflexi bacterium]|nr:hypothetical protein [Chloroflexota bacterium]
MRGEYSCWPPLLLGQASLTRPAGPDPATPCHGGSIEGLGSAEALDPLQAAFIQADAFQCGFCTPGQVMSLKGLLLEHPEPTDEEILRAISGNLCRCGAYHNILRAERLAAEQMAGPRG